MTGPAGFGAESGRLDLHAIFARRQFFRTIASLTVRQNEEAQLRLRVLRLDKRALDRRAVRPLYGTRNLSSVARRRKAENNSRERQQFRS